jgi:hypothetical protein
MLRSWSGTLVSVRQVTQRNTGRRTAGIGLPLFLGIIACRTRTGRNSPDFSKPRIGA